MRQVLGGMAPNLQATLLGIELRVVAGTTKAAILSVVDQWKSLVRTERREPDDVAVRPDTSLDRLAEF